MLVKIVKIGPSDDYSKGQYAKEFKKKFIGMVGYFDPCNHLYTGKGYEGGTFLTPEGTIVATFHQVKVVEVDCLS